ncbi:MAG: lipoyl synthase [Candidatus Woesearchaeota archaeon]|jgi:lipoic acid synthetase|nr:lipoyl synthase [Candidatus Woesearchaeota archaeon]MDP7322998.1 lipoyl synthase [Candidatus Woesearchaeota archaeon]
MSGLIQIKPQRRHPDWFKIKFPSGESYGKVKGLVKTNRLRTICEEAKCPNLSECWSHGTATFLILGDTCTRYCGYCNVKTGKPEEVDFSELKKVADAVKKLNLKYVVITSVTRDDLGDGGASIYVDTIKEIRKLNRNCKVELLIPDFRLRNKDNKNNRDDKISIDALKKVIGARVDVLGHNIEAVRRIFLKVRKGGNYDLSLQLLKTIKKINKKIKTKSGIILGLGETKEEIIETMQELRDNDVDFLTLGQYLQPSEKHVKIEKYYKPEEFGELKEIGLKMGFRHVEAGPLVRSSYRADRLDSMIE